MFFNGRAATGIRNGQWGRCESCILIILGHKTDSVASIWSIASKMPQTNQNQKQNWILFWQPEIGSWVSLQLQDCWHSSAERKYNHNQKTLSSFLLSTPEMYWIAPCTSLHLNLGDQTAHGIITVDAWGCSGRWRRVEPQQASKHAQTANGFVLREEKKNLPETLPAHNAIGRKKERGPFIGRHTMQFVSVPWIYDIFLWFFF